MRTAVELWCRSVDSWTSFPQLSTQFPSGAELAGVQDVLLLQNWAYELGDSERTDDAPFIEDEFAGATPYASSFLEGQHYNLLGQHETLGPVIVSIQQASPARTLIRTRVGTLRVLIPQEHCTRLGLMLKYIVNKKFPPPPSGHSYHDLLDLSLLKGIKFTLLGNTQLQQDLREFEEHHRQNRFKVGVLWVKAQQESEEDWFGNGHANDPPSLAYEEFLNTLGQRVDLSYPGYLGGLDEGDGAIVHTTPEVSELKTHATCIFFFSC
jgi:hypothetical protein